jgi:peptidoglycan/xylan/chitin deacetylase (PgdA/CDA1 family)
LTRRIERLFFLARHLLYWRGVHLAGGIPQDQALLVLCYHAIRDLAADPLLKPYAIPHAMFERHIGNLMRRGYHFVGGKEFAAYLSGEAGLPRKPVLLTFDDCYEDLLLAAAPILEKHAIPAVAFAVTGLASNSNEWDHRKGCTHLRLLDEQGLRAAAKTQIEIGAHSRTHRSLVGLSSSELSGETAGAASDIEAKGLPRPRYFAYPYGEEDQTVRDAVKHAGFEAGFSLASRRFTRDSDPMAIPRIEVLCQDTGLRFWLKTSLPEVVSILRYFARRASMLTFAGYARVSTRRQSRLT